MSINNIFLKSKYVSAPLANGVGRFVLQCQRMTIKFCKSHGGSRGVRDFIENDVVEFAHKNPSIVLYLKPRRHRSPVVVSEYLNGGREWMSLHEMSREEIAKWLEMLRTSAGYGEAHYKNYHHTDCPSIQGVWNPFTYQPPENNVLSFPNEKFAEPPNLVPSATEIVKKLYGNELQ